MLYAGDIGITFARDHGLVDDDLVRSNGVPVLPVATRQHAARALFFLQKNRL